MKIEFSLHFRSGGLFYFAAAEKKDLNDLASDVWSLTGIYDSGVMFMKNLGFLWYIIRFSSCTTVSYMIYNNCRCYSYEGSSSFSRYTCCTSTTSCIISSRLDYFSLIYYTEITFSVNHMYCYTLLLKEGTEPINVD
ncbi:hypothetical protein HanRHA438_Chr15g0717721 [Helianthus annuus]|nr:hypothetical protein HanRHA438_Chr15g0717721 [Helianthus annuus]